MLSNVRVGFYFNPPRAWNWPSFLSGDLGLSGTDAQVLRVADYLSRRDGIDVVLLQRQEPSLHPHVAAQYAGSALESVRAAHELGLDVLVFNNRGDDDTRAAIALCDDLQQKVILWDQNGPDDAMADVVAKSTHVLRLLCVSAMQCDAMRHHAVFAKTEYVYNSVDPLFFRDRGTSERLANKVIWLGSLTLTKGFHLLAAAWPHVRAAVPEATLTVLGSAQLYDDAAALGPLRVAAPDYELEYLVPYLGATREQCAALGISFFGLASPAVIRDQLLSAAVGVVNPHAGVGSFETFCVSAVEIESCGGVVVGGDAGGLRETVSDGRTGLLVRGERELASALISLLRNPVRTAQMGEAGRRFVARAFAPGVITDRWVQLLLDVVGDRPAKPPSFAFRRLTRTSLLRETLRRGKALPLVGPHMPTLQSLRTLARAVRTSR